MAKDPYAPHPIPGEPADVSVATAAAAKTMGVPAATAASTIKAGKSGDKKAQKGLLDAKRVYVAAKRGDPLAANQIARVQADAKTGDPGAVQKAAFLSGAIGYSKGWSNYSQRQEAQAKSTPQRPPWSKWPWPFIFGPGVYEPFAQIFGKR